MAKRIVHVQLYLDPGEPLSGRIRGPAGPAEPFRGWLDLAGRLERLRLAAPTEHLSTDERFKGLVSRGGATPPES